MARGVGGAATGGQSASLAQSSTGGDGVGTITPPAGESGGCGCVVAGKNAGHLNGALGGVLMLSALAFRRRRASTRHQNP